MSTAMLLDRAARCEVQAGSILPLSCCGGTGAASEMLGVRSAEALIHPHGDCERSPVCFSKTVFLSPCSAAVKSQEQGQEILQVPAHPQLVSALKV